MTNLNQYSFVV